MIQEFFSNPYFSKTIASVVLTALCFAARNIVVRTILRNAPKSDARRRWVVSARNVTWLVIAVGLVVVWSEAIESFGTAVLAVSVAFVLATRELIQATLGSFVRTTTDMYSVGDRIELGPHRGDVVDLSLFSTKILEVGPGKDTHLRTGRTIIIPNSKLLENVVVNESSMKQYVVHSFTVPVLLETNWNRAETILLEAAEAECAPFLEEARRHMESLEREHGLQKLPLKPRVMVELAQPDRVNLTVRLPAPVGRQGTLQQSILRRYLDEVAGKKGVG